MWFLLLFLFYIFYFYIIYFNCIFIKNIFLTKIYRNKAPFTLTFLLLLLYSNIKFIKLLLYSLGKKIVVFGGLATYKKWSQKNNNKKKEHVSLLDNFTSKNKKVNYM